MEKYIYSPFARALKEILVRARRRGGLKQRDLARKLRTFPGVIGSIEVGQRRVDVFELFQICRVCGVDPREAAREVMEEFLRVEAERKKEDRGRKGGGRSGKRGRGGG